MSKLNSVRRKSPVTHCIFCGKKNPTSEEHILAKWIYRAIDKNNIQYNKIRNYTRTDSKGMVTEFCQVQAEDATSPILCDDCNNKWGSDLQTEVADTLRPFIIGKWTALDKGQIFKIVKWFTSYLMVREMLHDGHEIHTTRQRRAFRYKSKIPTSLNLWIAPIENAELSSIHRGIIDYLTLEPSEDIDIYIAVQAVGKVIFVAYGMDPKGNYHKDSGGYYGIYQCLIHHNLTPLWLMGINAVEKFPKRMPDFCLTNDVDYLCNHVTNAMQDYFSWFPKGRYRKAGKVLIDI